MPGLSPTNDPEEPGTLQNTLLSSAATCSGFSCDNKLTPVSAGAAAIALAPS